MFLPRQIYSTYDHEYPYDDYHTKQIKNQETIKVFWIQSMW